MSKKYTRKGFLLRGTAALASGVTLGSACASSTGESPITNEGKSQKTFNWKMVTTWPPNFPVLGEGCNLFAKWVEKMSGGRLKISVFGGGELVPALQVFDTVSAGTAELGNGAAYYWAGKVPAAQFFASVPFGMNAQQMNAWLINGGGQELWDEVYAPFNLRGFPSGNTGVQMGGWFNREINQLSDLKGLKMRIPGIGGKVIAEAGGSAVNMAGGEIYTNLERGVIDATEWIGPYHDYKMGFHKIAKYYYYPGWHETGSTLETLVNRSKFESLPEDLQEILLAGIARQNIWTLSAFESQNNFYLKKLVEEEGVSLRSFPPEVLGELTRISDRVLKEMCQDDPLSAKVYSAYRDFQTNANEWAQVSERVFQNQLAS